MEGEDKYLGEFFTAGCIELQNFNVLVIVGLLCAAYISDLH